MNRQRWKTKIKNACAARGTYNENFDITIDALAKILEIRDKAILQFDDIGQKPVVEKTNNKGFSNLEKHPSINIINEYSLSALSYLRELGLTPKGFKTVGAESKNTSNWFEDIIHKLEDEYTDDDSEKKI